jgi:hypothetical protein
VPAEVPNVTFFSAITALFYHISAKSIFYKFYLLIADCLSLPEDSRRAIGFKDGFSGNLSLGLNEKSIVGTKTRQESKTLRTLCGKPPC